MLFLVWDEESEEHLDSTVLNNTFSAADAGPEKKKRKKDESSSSEEELARILKWNPYLIAYATFPTKKMSTKWTWKNHGWFIDDEFMAPQCVDSLVGFPDTAPRSMKSYP